MRLASITSLAGMLGIEKVSRDSGHVYISCPLAPWTHKSGKDSHPSLSIAIDDKQRSGWRCHGCGRKGALGRLVMYYWQFNPAFDPTPLFDFIDKEENSLEAAGARWDARFEAAEHSIDPALKLLSVDRNLDVFSEKEMEPFSGAVPQYILDRGFSVETCRAWGLGYDPNWRDYETGIVRPRLVFPVRRPDGKLVGMVGRAIDGIKEKKYYNYWNFLKSKYLYGLDKVPDRSRIVVVEGMLDTIRFWEYGLPAGGIFGAEPHERQAKLMMEFDKVYLALDKDKAGYEGEEFLKHCLRGCVPLFSMVFPAGIVDPKEMTKEQAVSAYENALRIS